MIAGEAYNNTHIVLTKVYLSQGLNLYNDTPEKVTVNSIDSASPSYKMPGLNSELLKV